MFIFLVVFLILFQLFMYGPVFCFFFNRIWPGRMELSFRGPGFILPFLFFYARDLRFVLHGTVERDRAALALHRLHFYIHPLLLLIGRLVLRRLELYHPVLHYFNRQPSHEKTVYLPGRHRLEIQRGSVHGGHIYVVDESYSPPYIIELHEIELENADMDAGTPVDLLFRTGRGRARWGGGRLEIGQSGGRGYLRLWGTSWAQIAGRRDALFMQSKLGLLLEHEGGAEERSIQGVVGNIAARREESTLFDRANLRPEISFGFRFSWQELQLPFDLGIQVLLGKMLETTSARGLSRSILPGLRGLFELLKKQEKA
ncbi:MAG: hypothetical protein HS115_10475 [Spirochaetales bacterium]|nr:hypothetical protein [Spirochaetales bacterium]